MKAVLLLSLGAFALANPVRPGHKIAFTRRNAVVTREDGSVDGRKLIRHVRETIRKYDKDYVFSEIVEETDLDKRAGGTGTIGLTDQNQSGEDELYYGVGTIGAAEQSFTFDFDTGSSDVFVPGPSCSKSAGCQGTAKYNQKGQDQKNTTSIMYGSGAVQGENYVDSLTVAGITASNQNIVSLTSASGFSTSKSDGLVGLAFQSIAASKSTPFFFNLVNQKQLASNEFSFYLGRVASNTSAKSELTLGGRDSSRYTGAFTQVPVTSQTYWEVEVQAANVGGTAVNGGSAPAAVDTGTTVVIAPSIAAAAIYGKIKGSFVIPLVGGITEQFYAYPCSASPQVSFTLAGKQFVINALDFNLGTLGALSGFPIIGPLLGILFPNSGVSSQYCIGGIVGSNVNTPPIYILGDTFLKNWYSSFQYVSPTQAFVNLAKAN